MVDEAEDTRPRRAVASGIRRLPVRVAHSGREWWSGSLPDTARARVRQLDLDTHALALCGQQVLCTVPLVVAMSAVIQRENAHSTGMGAVTARFFGLHGSAAHAVTELLGRPAASIGTGALVFSLITAVVFSTGVASVQQRAFELIWALPRVSGVRSYLRQLVWAVGLGAFSLAMLFASRAGRFLNQHLLSGGFVTGLVLQGVLIFAFYLWSQHWLLGGRVASESLVAGAAAIAVGTAVMFRVSRLIVPESIDWQVHAYGLVGVAFVLSAWLGVLCMVIFGGALVGALVAQRRAEKRGEPAIFDAQGVAITAEVVFDEPVDEPVDGPVIDQPVEAGAG